LKLSFIGHKGLVIWPNTTQDRELDMLQFRFISDSESSYSEILEIQQKVLSQNLEIVMVNTLTEYDGKQGFSKGQGE
jgi:hypothetical protein